MLAWRLAEFLKLVELQAAVVHHWCCAKIHDAPASLSDEALLSQLRTKMCLGAAAAHPRVADIAAEAHRVGHAYVHGGHAYVHMPRPIGSVGSG